MNFFKKLFRKRKEEVKKVSDKNSHHCITCGTCIGTGVIKTSDKIRICPYCGGNYFLRNEEK
ncbi:hypothetical protein [Kordia sp.]|uniref:hypothetical protein n=1 Tax=Kordia sp. TaxID=1965332 RepID=UPI003D2943DB